MPHFFNRLVSQSAFRRGIRMKKARPPSEAGLFSFERTGRGARFQRARHDGSQRARHDGIVPHENYSSAVVGFFAAALPPAGVIVGFAAAVAAADTAIAFVCKTSRDSSF